MDDKNIMGVSKNKIIIISIFIIVALSIFILFKTLFNDNNKTPMTDQEAKDIITESLGEDIEKIENRTLVLTNNKKYTLMVVDDRYILLDHATVPPTIHDYQSVKEDIDVTYVGPYEDGHLVEHDDHVHIISDDALPEGVQPGDTIQIKDPHTYLDGHE